MERSAVIASSLEQGCSLVQAIFSANGLRVRPGPPAVSRERLIRLAREIRSGESPSLGGLDGELADLTKLGLRKADVQDLLKGAAFDQVLDIAKARKGKRQRASGLASFMSEFETWWCSAFGDTGLPYHKHLAGLANARLPYPGGELKRRLAGYRAVKQYSNQDLMWALIDRDKLNAKQGRVRYIKDKLAGEGVVLPPKVKLRVQASFAEAPIQVSLNGVDICIALPSAGPLQIDGQWPELWLQLSRCFDQLSQSLGFEGIVEWQEWVRQFPRSMVLSRSDYERLKTKGQGKAQEAIKFTLSWPGRGGAHQGLSEHVDALERLNNAAKNTDQLSYFQRKLIYRVKRECLAESMARGQARLLALVCRREEEQLGLPDLRPAREWWPKFVGAMGRAPEGPVRALVLDAAQEASVSLEAGSVAPVARVDDFLCALTRGAWAGLRDTPLFALSLALWRVDNMAEWFDPSAYSRAFAHHGWSTGGEWDPRHRIQRLVGTGAMDVVEYELDGRVFHLPKAKAVAHLIPMIRERTLQLRHVNDLEYRFGRQHRYCTVDMKQLRADLALLGLQSAI